MGKFWDKVRGRDKAIGLPTPPSGWVSSLDSNVIKEAFTGAWQRNIDYHRETCLENPTVFSCISLISSDISKLRMGVVKKDSQGIWTPVPFGEKWKVLTNPNQYQNRIQFFQQWMLSILCRGNTYILKVRGQDGTIERLYILNPDLVLPLVTPEGDVYYQLGTDNLSGIGETGVTVPASEIIHDRINCLFHPLVGIAPLFAACLQAGLSQDAIKQSAYHFKNGARPTGIITAPGAISKESADALKAAWESGYGGENYGKTAVLGSDLKYIPVSRTAAESQMIEQLKWNDEKIASVFHVPFYMVGGSAPSYDNVGALSQQYYSQCLQIYIESIEECLDQNLGFPDDKTGVEFDLDGLLRMDKKAQIETLGTGVNKGIYAPNEARKEQNLKPLDGGDSVYLQQQNYSLEALAKRDASEDPFKTSSGSSSANSNNSTNNNTNENAANADNNVKDVMLRMIANRENVTYVA